LIYDVLIFFIYMIVFLGGLGSFFLVLKGSLNVNDAIHIDPKPPISVEKE